MAESSVGLVFKVSGERRRLPAAAAEVPRAATDHSATFRCSVETRMPAHLGALAQLALLPIFLRRHTRDETIGFAWDIARKAAQGSLRKA